MPISMEHAGLVEIFRANPRLVPQLLEASFGVELPAWETITVAEAELDQLAPIEFRADLVVELAGATGPPRLSAVLEVQLRPDEDKPFTWPVVGSSSQRHTGSNSIPFGTVMPRGGVPSAIRTFRAAGNSSAAPWSARISRSNVAIFSISAAT